MSQTLGFSVVQKSSAFKNYFATYHLTTALEATQLLPYLSQLRPFLNQFLIAQLVEHHGLKIFPILFAVYEKHPLKEEDQPEHVLMPMAISPITIQNHFEITELLNNMATQFITRNENLLRDTSLSNLPHIDHLELHIAEHNPLDNGGGTYADLTEFLFNKSCLSM